jgi:hypothetical protein
MPTRPRSCNRKTTSGCSAMIRKLGLIGAVAGVALAAQTGGAGAQYFTPDGVDKSLLGCDLWHPVPDDKPGTQRRLFVWQLVSPPPPRWSLGGRYALVAGAIEGGARNGFFALQFKSPLAFWSDPNGTDATTLFTVRKGSAIEFFTPDRVKLAEATSGYLTQRFEPQTTLPALPSILCERREIVAGDSPEAKSPIHDKPPRTMVIVREPEQKIGDVFKNKAPAASARPTPESPRPEPSEPKAAEPKAEPKVVTPAPDYLKNRPLSEVVPAIPRTPEPSKKISETLTAAATPTASTPDAPAPAPAEKPPTGPAAAEGPPATAVCSVTDLTRIPVAPGVAPTDRQLVGLRSSQAEVKGFAYVNVGGDDVFPVDFTFDLPDSTDKLLPYEQMLFKDGKLSVSIRDLEWAKAKSKSEAAAKPGVALRIVVFGGPQEIAISGLDKVGAELKKESKGKVRVDVRWYPINSTSGSLLPARYYDSFGALIEAARKEGTGLAARLDERQIKTFLGSLEEELKKESTPVDKVFWVKGGYFIPSSIPERFERLIRNVSDSGAILRTPSGEVGEWLIVLSEYVGNGSSVYLQVPLQSQVRGKVIEAASGSKQLISDPHPLALTLNATGIRRLATAGATPPAPPAPPAPANTEPPAGKPVLDAGEVFTQRGYLLSGPVALLLRNHLSDVKDLWIETGAAAINTDSLKDIAGKMHKSWTTLTLVDVLQDDNGGGLKLPKLLPDWSRKPLSNLTVVESREALTLVRRYLTGIKQVIEGFDRPESTRVPPCTLLFAPDELFGFPAEPALLRR